MPGHPVFDGSALRAARERAGLTQHQLARLVEVAGGERISRWELGLSVPRPAMVARLVRALRVDPGVLVPVPGPSAGAGARLRAARVRAGLSVEQVATALHVSADTYARWEAAGVPPPAFVERLADVLGIPPGGSLLDGSSV